MSDLDPIKSVKKAWGYEIWIHNSPKYCGKMLVFKKGCKFSMHFHMIKEETWYVSRGEFVYSWIDTGTADRHSRIIEEGDTIHIQPGHPHQLQANTNNAEIFEVSTEHFDDDSYRVEKGDSQL